MTDKQAHGKHISQNHTTLRFTVPFWAAHPASSVQSSIYLHPSRPIYLSPSSMPTCLFAGPISPLCTRKKKNSTAKVFNSNFISSAAARKLTQQPLESKVTLGSPLTVLYANRPAPGQWSRPAESLLMQIWLSESILLERVRGPPTPQVIFHRIGCLRVPEEGEWRRGGKKVREKDRALAIPRMEGCWFDEHLFLPTGFHPSRFYSIRGQMECKWHRTSVISYAHFVNGLTSQYVQHTTITECGINPLIKW